jgi:hypothetical protein
MLKWPMKDIELWRIPKRRASNMAKLGRNAPCPCGSGKKNKKCCMMKRQTESFTRTLVHRKTDELIPEILEYATRQLPEDAIHDAWDDFESGKNRGS